MNLLIDFGNTRLKWASHVDGEVRPGGVFAHQQQSLAAAASNDWLALPRRPESVLVASVVGEKREAELTALCRSVFRVDPVWLKTPRHALGVNNGYRQPNRLGIDRFLAMVAMHAKSPRAQVLVSCGTALTLDALAADGEHHGGLILASPDLMRSALRSATARLAGPCGKLVEMATTTNDAIQSGALLAAIALIGRFRRQTAAKLGAVPVIVLTGGGSAELSPWLPDSERHADLVLHGLARWAEAELRA
ncbi:MAG: type III pantothenate kinase [Dokdonella sp.]